MNDEKHTKCFNYKLILKIKIEVFITVHSCTRNVKRFIEHLKLGSMFVYFDLSHYEWIYLDRCVQSNVYYNLLVCLILQPLQYSCIRDNFSGVQFNIFRTTKRYIIQNSIMYLGQK